MNSALEAYFVAVESEHRGTRWAFWIVVFSAGYLAARIVVPYPCSGLRAFPILASSADRAKARP